jgi:sigma-B regulation protein RsbU (phosphoserine phosphatase)
MIASELQNPVILIVDDNPENINVLGQILRADNCQVEFAVNGYSALEWTSSKKFDIIILDVNMPGMNGFEVGPRIKNSCLNSETPLIYLTANTDTASLVKGFESGGLDYITKPFIRSELLTRIRSQIRIKKANDQIRGYLDEIEMKNHLIIQSLEYALDIQNAVLGTFEKNDREPLSEHFILNLPKDTISGDFYRFYRSGNKAIAAIMDCTGHGVPGALMSILGITLFNETVLKEHILQPDKILNRLTERFMQSLGQTENHSIVKDGMEGSVVCLDTETGMLQYAGSFNQLIMVRDGELIEIRADRLSIGYDERGERFSLKKIKVRKNDHIYLFTDGYLDQFGGQNDKRYMIRKFRKLLLQINNEPLAVQRDILFETIMKWKGDTEQTDDILVLGMCL